MRTHITATALLLALSGAAHAEMPIDQAESNFNIACRTKEPARDEACGIAMQYMYSSTIDALAQCAKEHPKSSSDVVTCIKGWGQAAGLQ
jgi:hypothetical protein